MRGTVIPSKEATSASPPNLPMMRDACVMADNNALSALACQRGNNTGVRLRFSHTPAMDIEWIRKHLAKPGKTQRGLAAAMGIDTTGVNRLLNGKRRLQASEVEKVRAYLGEAGSAPVQQPFIAQSATMLDQMLEVKGMAEGGPDGWNLFNGDVIDHIRRPDNLVGVPGAYAVYVNGTSMEPRYHAGETVHIHPGRPLTPGCYVLVQKKPKAAGEPPLAVIKRLVRRSGSKVVLEQYTPAKTFEIKADEIVSMHRVVGSSEG